MICFSVYLLAEATIAMKKILNCLIAMLFAVSFYACGVPDHTEGGLVFKTVSLNKKGKIASAKISWTSSVEVMKAASGSEDEEEAARLNAMISSMIFEGEKDVKIALEHKQKEYFSSISEDDNIRSGNGNELISWEGRLYGKVISVDGQFISYELSDFSQSGSSSGNTMVTYSVFDRQSGHEAPLSFFIPEEKKPELQHIIRDTMVQEKELSSYEDLKKDFLISDLDVTNNFYADEMGLHFVYNAGEIASHSEGPQNILIRWDVLKPIMNEGIM